jgi:putative FmdB family regulatory protein
MPIYEYACESCGGLFEVTRKFSDPPIAACTLCGAASIRKLLSPTTFVLKGSGWYATDYAAKKEKEKPDAPPEKTAVEAKPAAGCAAGNCPGACPSKN